MAQITDAELTALAQQIATETQVGANTAARVGTMLQDIIDSKKNNEEYLVYVARIIQLGTSISAVVLKNTLGFTPNWIRTSAGQYYTENGSEWIDRFNTNKIAVFFNCPGNVATNYFQTVAKGFYDKEENNLKIETAYLYYDTTIKSEPADGLMNDDDAFRTATIEVRVYP